MRYVLTTGPEQMSVRDGAPPTATDAEVLVRVEAVGLCGGDYTFFAGTHPYARFPQVQGHEVVGTVVQDGAGVLRVGQRVAIDPIRPCGGCYPCRRGRPNCCSDLAVMGVHEPGGLAEVIAVPGERVHATGELAAEVAVLTEPVAIGLQAVHRAGVAAGDRAVVLGAGPIGLFAALAAWDRGARVLVADRLPARLTRAGRLGAARMVDTSVEDLGEAVAEFTDGDGAAVVIEATGVPALVRQAVDLVAHAGTVAVVGLSTEPVGIPMVEFTRKELTVVGSRNSVNLFPAAVELVGRHADAVAPMVTQIFPLGETPKAIAYARAHPDEVMKVVIRVAG